ncbi:MAG TPA: dihydroorotase [Vicinamibacteria bacterium]|nr:dihydroorotase [Vicinamibacteria bacterium]
MAESFDLVVAGGTCVGPRGRERADVGVVGGLIAALGDLRSAPAAERVEAVGLHVLPGVVDTQVHFREPGLTHKEDLATGSAAAVLGGVTSVFEMPNTRPPTTTAAALGDKVERARGRMHCDHAFYVGATPENARDLHALEGLPGCCGVKVFMGSSTGELLVPDDEGVEAVLRGTARRVSFHAEDEARLRERLPLAAAGRPETHPLWRDAETARLATARLLALARKLRRRVHVLHVTTAEEMDLLAAHRNLASVEVTPQHLTLAAPECYERLQTRAQMNPPIRDARHREALWAAVSAGLVDVVGSDHAPHTLEEKAGQYPATPSGMTGVQTLLPLLLDHAHRGRLGLERVVELTSSGAARVFGIVGKGRIAVGEDADLVLVDLNRRETITNARIRSRCGWTPFDGMAVTGWPVATVLRGHVVMREGEILGPPLGQPLRFVASPGEATA